MSELYTNEQHYDFSAGVQQSVSRLLMADNEVNKIENGELGELLRDVIVLGTAPEFFNSIDARGKDFIVRPITNCGKGDPMQIMRMGNGGPHIRGTATVKSVGI